MSIVPGFVGLDYHDRVQGKGVNARHLIHCRAAR